MYAEPRWTLSQGIRTDPEIYIPGEVDTEAKDGDSDNSDNNSDNSACPLNEEEGNYKESK